MSLAFQPCLFDEPAPTVAAFDGLRRTPLSRGAWIDVLPNWIGGADAIFEELIALIPWWSESREMYDRMVEVPRLVHTYGIGAELPHPALAQARESLTKRYAGELGEPFVTAGCCYYRDGNDSVAWHGDNLGRGRSQDTVVAIVSLGSPRKLLLRPKGGRAEVGQLLGHGDLFVMGGSCQRTWEHAVPKSTRPVGPRISIQFRARNVF